MHAPPSPPPNPHHHCFPPLPLPHAQELNLVGVVLPGMFQKGVIMFTGVPITCGQFSLVYAGEVPKKLMS